MSVSIDEHTADEHESVQNVLAGWLDDYQAGRCDRGDMEDAFLSVCGSDPEAPWDALSLLDRYQRLGRVDRALACELKAKISQLAVGASSNEMRLPPRQLDTDTRWRKSTADQDSESLHTDDIDASSAVVRDPNEGESNVHRAAQDAREENDDEKEAEEDAELLPPSLRAAARSSAFAERGAQMRASARTHNSQPASSMEHARYGSIATQPSSFAAQHPSHRVLRERYELLSVLAHGQTSTIYKALDRHRAHLVESARYVAVKVLHGYEGRPEVLAQLEREFYEAQSLSHPNIASVFDLDRDGSTYFIVMDLLEGESLASVLRRLHDQPMARKNAFVVIGGIGAALAYAHRRAVVHGDLKPRNVMITPSGEVRVLEFGFARAHTSHTGEPDDAHGGITIGTQAYASAERVHGMEPDASDDVYSLACIAYELLSGRHPYGGRSAVLARAQGRRPARPSGLTHKQWHALSRALAWDRADRKIEVSELLTALEIPSDAGQTPVPPELLAIPEDVRGQRLRRLGAVFGVLAAVAIAVYFVTRIPPPLQQVDATTVAPVPAIEAGEASTTSVQSTPDPDSSAAQPAPAPVQPAQQEDPAEGQTPASERSQEEPPASANVSAAAPRARTQTPTRAEAAGPVTIALAKDTFVVSESDAAARVEVRRTGSTRNAVNFRWTLQSNSAAAGSDFADIGPGFDQIGAGARTATILIPLVNDGIVENTELFLIEIEPLDEGVQIGANGHAAVIIVDDD